MATASRVFWESIIFMAFLAIVAGVVFWSGSRVDRNAESLAVEHEQALEAADHEHRQEIEDLNRSWADRSDARARAQARAVFSAFEAGIHTAAAARWGRYLDSAREDLMTQPAVTFVHLVSPQGRVITSSDEALAATGRLDEGGDWALAAQELVSRDGQASGAFELAAPINEGGRTVAILWMGYDLRQVKADSPAPS
jgi:hypothetical protein